MINKLLVNSLGLLCIGLVSCGQAYAISSASDLGGSMTIRPSAPTASWPSSGEYNELAPNYTATISVTVIEQEEVGGVNYVLSSGPDGTTGSSDPNLVWTESGTTFSITNTASNVASASMTLTCVWSPEGGDGEGEGEGPGDIYGQADADVQLLDSVVDWEFDRTRQWADGEKELWFEITITDDNGFGLERWTAIGFSAADATPENPDWTSTQVFMSPGWLRAVKVKSSTPSKGKVLFEYNDGSNEVKISPAEIAFITIKLLKVSFSGTGYRTIQSDDGSTNFSAPHWNDPNGDGTQSDGHAHPVIYVSDSKLTIAPEWGLEPEVSGVNIKIKASGPDSISIGEAEAAVSGSTVSLASPGEATEKFENNIVRYWEGFVLNFEASFQDEDDWIEVGASKNQFYVTREAPMLSPIPHTVAHIGCSSANNQSVPAVITSCIWGEFSSGTGPQNVKNVNGEDLSYYKSYLTNSSTTAGLLADKDGQCLAWVRFFLDCLKVHGISNSDNIAKVTPDVAGEGLLIKNWGFTGNGTSGDNEYPYLGIPESQFTQISGYSWKFSEVTDTTGLVHCNLDIGYRKSYF